MVLAFVAYANEIISICILFNIFKNYDRSPDSSTG